MNNKYHARKTRIDGVLFDSKAEAVRYAELRLMARAGEIERLRLQPRYVIHDATALYRLKHKLFLARYPSICHLEIG